MHVPAWSSHVFTPATCHNACLPTHPCHVSRSRNACLPNHPCLASFSHNTCLPTYLCHDCTPQHHYNLKAHTPCFPAGAALLAQAAAASTCIRSCHVRVYHVRTACYAEHACRASMGIQHTVWATQAVPLCFMQGLTELRPRWPCLPLTCHTSHPLTEGRAAPAQLAQGRQLFAAQPLRGSAKSVPHSLLQRAPKWPGAPCGCGTTGR